MKDSTSEYDYVAKFILVGDSGVGKTNILLRYCKDEFKKDSKATVGLEFSHKFAKVGCKTVKLQIWDTAGQEKYKSITHSFYSHTSAALAVFDITRSNSFDKVDNWIQEVKQNSNEDVEILLIGNKSDLSDNRAISTIEGNEKAQNYGIRYLETSALSATNINEAFNTLLEKIVEKMKKKDELNLIEINENKQLEKQPVIKKEKGCC